MTILLDTNALIWAITDPTRITAKALRHMRSGENQLIVSLVSLWELSIKITTGKIIAVGSSIQYVVDEMHAQRIETLPITLRHIERLQRLDRHHRDPFDRMIIAQALEERLPVVTADKLFSTYEVDVLW